MNLLKRIGRSLNRLADWADRHYPYARVSQTTIIHLWVSAVLLMLAGGVMWFTMLFFDGLLWLLLFVLGDLLLLGSICLCLLQVFYFLHRTREFVWKQLAPEDFQKGTGA